MKLIVNKTDFSNFIATPASKLADNLLLNFVVEGPAATIKTLVASADNSVVFIGKTNCKVSNPTKCIIPECKTFLRLFSGIESQNDISLEITTNAIHYKDSSFSFKYHLLDEGYLTEKKSISEEKLNQIKFDTTFEITKSKLSEIFKYNSIIPEAEKLYFYTENQKILAKVGDDQKSNTNEIVAELASSFTGEELNEPLPINIQNILLMTFSTENIQVMVNKTLKIVKFSNNNVQYIVSGLVK